MPGTTPRRPATAALLMCGAVLAAVLSGCATPKPEGASLPDEASDPGPPRVARRGPDRIALVTRWDFRTPEDIAAIADAAADTGFTDLFWQVRGQADAFYPSPHEPWGQEIADPAGNPPAFDPLREAIDRARARGIRVHAWINVLPLWHGPTPPRDPEHPLRREPSWLLTDAAGAPITGADGYELANPTRADVRAHIARVVNDMVGRYDLDGICFDAMRLPTGLGGGPRGPEDAESGVAFAQAAELALAAGDSRGQLRARWLNEQMTALAAELAAGARAARPSIRITAIVNATPEASLAAHAQDAAAWLRDGIIDRVLVLTPAGANADATINAWRTAAGKPDRVIAGVTLHDAADGPAVEARMRTVGARTPVAVHTLAALVATADPGFDRSVRAHAVRTARRAALESLWNPTPRRAAEPQRTLAAPATPAETRRAERQRQTTSDKSPAESEPTPPIDPTEDAAPPTEPTESPAPEPAPVPAPEPESRR